MILYKPYNRKEAANVSIKVLAKKIHDTPTALVELGVYCHSTVRATLEIDEESAVDLCRAILKRFSFRTFNVVEKGGAS